MNTLRLTGLTAATHTPFDSDGSLKLAAVQAQAEHLIRHGIGAAFICGSTGESQSLSFLNASNWRSAGWRQAGEHR